MTRITPIAAALCVALAGCASVTPAQQAALTASATAAGTTLGTVAAQNSTTAQKIVADGVLICALQQAGFIAALGVNVTGATKTAMDAVCSSLGGIGAALPAGTDPASVRAVQVALKPA
jgi:uncharacterized protein YceK